MSDEPLDPELALARILEDARPGDLHHLPLDEADGRACAADVVAERALPAWDNSAKDGYAVSTAALARSRSLPVRGEVAAGHPPGAALPRDGVLRIMTGAPLPADADAVVPVEDTRALAGPGVFAADGEIVGFDAVPARGANVRPAGGDVRPGTVVIRRGDAVTPGRLALLAALGHAAVPVHRPPRVAVLATGDELVEPGVDAPPGRLYSSNVPALVTLARRAGAAAWALPLVADDPLLIRAAVAETLPQAEVLIATGGVSAGRHDHVRGVLEEAAGGLVFWKVRMRPGQPLVFARTADIPGIGRVPTRYLFGLPGNPTSALVTFLQFVRPLLRRLAGFDDIFLPTVAARLGESVEAEPRRRSFLRVRLERDGAGTLVARPPGAPGGGLLRALAHPEGLLRVGPGRPPPAAGEAVVVQLLDLPRGPAAPYTL